MGFIGSLISIPVMKKFGKTPNKSMYMGIASAVVISAILDIILVRVMGLGIALFIPVLAGLVLAMLALLGCRLLHRKQEQVCAQR